MVPRVDSDAYISFHSSRTILAVGEYGVVFRSEIALPRALTTSIRRGKERRVYVKYDIGKSGYEPQQIS